MVYNVVVTGSAGAVGQPVCRELSSRGHRVCGIDRRPAPQFSNHALDISERDKLLAVFQNTDVVIHLAAQAHDVPFHQLLDPNVRGLFNVMDAARQARVKRVILASSIQVAPRRGATSRKAGVNEASPDNHYALTKLWAEQMGRMYAGQFGISVIAVRVAWMVRDAEEARRMVASGRESYYLSPRDAGRCFALATEAKPIDYAVVYAIGPDGAHIVDMEPAKRLLGFEAQDRFPDGLGFTY